MNAVDATDRSGQTDDAEPPSLLTIILDTNPHAWALLSDSLPLSKAIANLLVFVNAHLAINHANRVAILASHAERAEWLYPTPSPANPEDESTNGDANADGQDLSDARPGGPVHPPDDANKYRPFAHIEHAVLRNLQHLIATTTPAHLSSTPATMMAGALTLALSHISKQTPSADPANRTAQFNYSDPTSTAGDNNLASTANASAGQTTQNLESRILILSVSGDLSPQYIPLMNAIFAAQRLDIPIDILKLAGDPVFLQQAADATGGIYLALDTPASRAGLLQYLMFAYLSDAAARTHLVLPGTAQAGVDFRAACFCHRRVVDIGFVCSICLSIFCEPLPDGDCLTCGSKLSMGNYGQRPVVVARKKKKKRQQQRDGGGTATPGSAGGTPVPG